MTYVTDETLDTLADLLVDAGLRLATAESCTGGLLAAACTSHPGSSTWFEGGFVTYRLSAKSHMLSIGAAELETHGAVSEHIAQRMARQTLEHSDADVSIATTGLAGPEGDGTDTPVGTLWIAWAGRDRAPASAWIEAERYELSLERAEFRHAAVDLALEGLVARLA